MAQMQTLTKTDERAASGQVIAEAIEAWRIAGEALEAVTSTARYRALEAIELQARDDFEGAEARWLFNHNRDTPRYSAFKARRHRAQVLLSALLYGDRAEKLARAKALRANELYCREQDRIGNAAFRNWKQMMADASRENVQ